MGETKRDPNPEARRGPEEAAGVPLVPVYENSPAGYEGTCLRPLGLCELGGSCDVCWYSPNHPRHRERG